MTVKSSVLAFAISLTTSAEALACYEKVSTAYGIPADLLRAIAYVESGGRMEAINENANGTRDVCAMQVNTWHLPRLEDLGVTEQLLRTNACLCIAAGAQILAMEIVRTNDVWAAIANYNTGPIGDPTTRYRYVQKVESAYRRILRGADK